ncbi:hypothetical protein GCM10009765_59010 [Fodinicola feengrottensis]|uniref:Uncharacterized protein n=1 Tax=Fodinicola feengrottensis TaxID=435914 RepID=A0ABN2IB99_9ACTN
MRFINHTGNELVFPSLRLRVDPGAEFEVTDENAAASLADQGFPVAGEQSTSSESE